MMLLCKGQPLGPIQTWLVTGQKIPPEYQMKYMQRRNHEKYRPASASMAALPFAKHHDCELTF